MDIRVMNVSHCETISLTKNAFQWEAYRPLVDRILARTGQGGVCPGGVCLGGRGVYPSMQWGQTLPLWTDRHL